MNKCEHYIKILLLSVAILVTDFSFSQSFDFNNIQKSLGNKEYAKLDSLFRSIETNSLSGYDKATLYYYLADYYFQIDKQDLAYKNILGSKKLFVELNKKKDAIDCNILMLEILSYTNVKVNTDDVIKETEQFALENGDSIALRTVYRRIGAKYIHLEKGEEAQRYFRKIIPIAIQLKDSIRIGYCYDNISLSFKYTNPPRLDSSLYYNKLAEKYYIKYNDLSTLAYNYNNRARIYDSLKDFRKSIVYLKKADSIPAKTNKLSDRILFYKNLITSYDSLKDYRNQSKYLKLLRKLEDSINNTAQNISIVDINKKYQTAEKEKEILEKRNWLIALSAGIALIVVVGYFLLKNSRRKRLLALQEKDLETQKNLTLLKEHEIDTINAMVEGQEKERKRVAEDLHDNLGSVIATLKLHFENLRINREKKKIDQETLFDKTENLIDEAYQKVRSIAHAKNAGVIVNQGLLIAVNLMAEKISSANSIKIEVVDYGLEKPIENTLEISLFRIIQELTTNIIKHAKASMATINISQDRDDITILIEDNGKGMNASQIDLKKGMGLHSIQTRVEHMDGSFTIDSTPTKGTTIIITIPL